MFLRHHFVVLKKQASLFLYPLFSQSFSLCSLLSQFWFYCISHLFLSFAAPISLPFFPSILHSTISIFLFVFSSSVCLFHDEVNMTQVQMKEIGGERMCYDNLSGGRAWLPNENQYSKTWILPELHLWHRWEIWVVGYPYLSIYLSIYLTQISILPTFFLMKYFLI